MAQDRQKTLDHLHDAIKAGLIAGMSPGDIELMVATIHRSLGSKRASSEDGNRDLLEGDHCPNHPEDYLRRKTTLPSLLRVANPVGDEISYCVGDGGNCTWVYSLHVGVFIRAGMAPQSWNDIFQGYKQARAGLG